MHYTLARQCRRCACPAKACCVSGVVVSKEKLSFLKLCSDHLATSVSPIRRSVHHHQTRLSVDLITKRVSSPGTAPVQRAQDLKREIHPRAARDAPSYAQDIDVQPIVFDCATQSNSFVDSIRTSMTVPRNAHRTLARQLRPFHLLRLEDLSYENRFCI